MQNMIVLHYLDGKILKGRTIDFSPGKPSFRFTNKDSGETSIVNLITLKGIFFVKDFDGVPEYGERYHIGKKGYGKKIKVTFRDRKT